MKTNATQLLIDLEQRAQQVLATVKMYRDLDANQLNRKPGTESWSALECLEHLNLYGDYYLPEIEKSVLNAAEARNAVFKSGVIGNYFANLMKAKPDGTVKKMKSPKDKIPALSDLSMTTVDRFLKQTEHLIHLVQLARNKDLTKAKTPISISKMIRLRLGDTFRFYVYHIERHVTQAERVRPQ